MGKNDLINDRKQLADKKMLYCMRMTAGVIGWLMVINWFMYLFKTSDVSQALQLTRAIAISICEVMILIGAITYREDSTGHFNKRCMIIMLAAVFILYSLCGNDAIALWILPTCMIGLYLDKAMIYKTLRATVILFIISSLFSSLIYGYGGRLYVVNIIIQLLIFGAELMLACKAMNISFQLAIEAFDDSVTKNEKLTQIGEQYLPA